MICDELLNFPIAWPLEAVKLQDEEWIVKSNLHKAKYMYLDVFTSTCILFVRQQDLNYHFTVLRPEA